MPMRAAEMSVERIGHAGLAMDADESRQPIRRVRPVERVLLPAGATHDLQEKIYWLYAEADCPRLGDLAAMIYADERGTLPGAPKKDVVHAIISGDGLASQQDTITVAMTLAHIAGRSDIAMVAELVRELWIAARAAPPVPPPVRMGRPVGDCDPFVLEVHPAIHGSSEHGERLDPLPRYVPRAHDGRLRTVVHELLASGMSRWVTLVGGSSTGKTRACWELVRYLEQQQPGRWRLWHPYDPTRPEAALADLERVGPNTVVWFNEAQFYLGPTDPGLGERIAAGLRSLLGDRGRGPVLVLATLWPEWWNTLTARPAGGEPDRFAQSRYLLTGTRIGVADGFTPEEVAGLRDAGVDPRLRQAAARAEGGRITQYLAGAPELQDRYDTAPPAARAIIQAAMDARRLGHPLPVPHALLERAATGYLHDHDWDSLDEDWLQQALAYTARPCKGARGPLTRIRARDGDPIGGSGQPHYRLADYLEQTGRRERASIYPPASLWTAFITTVTDPSLLRQLGHQARDRGRYQQAIPLYTRAADHGDTNALRNLAEMAERSGDTACAEALAVRAAELGNTNALRDLAVTRERAGDTAGAETLYQRAVDHGDSDVLPKLAIMRERAGDAVAAETLAVQAANSGRSYVLWDLAVMREEAGDTLGADALAVKAAAHGNYSALKRLAKLREQAGDTAGAEALHRQAAAVAPFDVPPDPKIDILVLAEARERDGDTEGAEALYRQAAAVAPFVGMDSLAKWRERTGDTAGAEALYWEATDRGYSALYALARMRDEAGDATGANRIRRFGLTESGEIATTLNFGPLDLG